MGGGGPVPSIYRCLSKHGRTGDRGGSAGQQLPHFLTEAAESAHAQGAVLPGVCGVWRRACQEYARGDTTVSLVKHVCIELDPI